MNVTKALLALALLLPACAAAEVNDEATGTASQELKGGTDRPIHGTCSLSFVVLSPPPFVTQRDTGTCAISHLGENVGYNGINNINFITGVVTSTRTFTADNGDTLTATGVGRAAPGPGGTVNFNATLTITGGTGRFEGASGSLAGAGTANSITKTTQLSLVGKISY